jgi:DNA-binding transcriptional LysR family regulator
MIADDLDTVRLLTSAGLGIALIPDVAAHTDVERGNLVRVLPAYALRDAPIHLVSAPLRHVPVRVKLLRDYLVREIPRRLAGTPCSVDASTRDSSELASGRGGRYRRAQAVP